MIGATPRLDPATFAAFKLRVAIMNVANLDESTAHWIELIAKRGWFLRILNQRTGQWKEYAARR